MLTLYRMNGVLHAKCRLNLKRGITFNGKSYTKSMFGSDQLVEVDAVIAILTENGCIRIFNGEKFVRFGLGEFSDIILSKEYTIEDIEEEKVVEIPVLVEEEPKVEVSEEIEEDEEPKEQPQNNDNKKQRHKK